MDKEVGLAVPAMDREQLMWRMRLESAVRTAVACTIVGCITLYGPSHLRSHLTFPAFSYVTAILIVSDATLGDTLRGMWHAFCATVQVVPVSILCLWIIRPASFSPASAALAVALMAFVVALPERTEILLKRIAFGQVVIVYVGAVVYGDEAGAVMHPLHVASSTVLGALASVIAALLPFPRLASNEVMKLFQLYSQNASARTSLFIRAFLSQDNSSATEAISQSKPFSETGEKLFKSIRLIQGGLPWERPRFRYFKQPLTYPEDQLKDMETAIRGMEMAATSCPSFPSNMIDRELSTSLQGIDIQLRLKLNEAEWFLRTCAIASISDTRNELLDKAIQTLATISPTQDDLPIIFQLFCIGILVDIPRTQSLEFVSDDIMISDSKGSGATQEQAKGCLQRIMGIRKILPSTKGLTFALKCSISLGLAVLFGTIFSKDNGYWSGLTIAISFATEIQPTFTVANARAQGTAMGSAYGVLGCFFFHKLTEMRFLILLPWIIFASFLRHSRMYGQAGGISAVIGALLILGRKNYGPPDEFAITRLTEAFIGLSCLIMVELIFQRAIAATLVKDQLSRSLRALEDCIQQISFPTNQRDIPEYLSLLALKEKQKSLKAHVNALEELIKDAEMEPNFCYLPFRTACYDKLVLSVSKMVILLQFVTSILETLPQISNSFGDEWRELQEPLVGDLQLLKEDVTSSLKCLEKLTRANPFSFSEKGMEECKPFHDLEAGKCQHRSVPNSLKWGDTTENIANAFLQHLMQLAEKVRASECEEDDLKGKVALYLGSFGFCVNSLMRETKAIENGMKEVIRWENPSRHINFNEINSKIDAANP